jgi:folate-binding protein YgfZ
MQNAKTDAAFADLNNTSCYMTLDQLGVLSVSGDDSAAFLQNLLTNDINLLSDHQSQYSGLCNPKGRLLALFLVIRTAESQYQLIMPKALCEPIAKRLTMYILRSKVTLSDDSEQLACIGLTQHHNKLNLTETDYQGAEHADYHYTKLPAAIPRWLMICAKENLPALTRTLAEQNHQNQTADYWQWLDITAGLANIYPDSQEKFTPQQLNLDLTEAVNFKKGCYPGQEVVARLHYLGKPSRRLFIASANTALHPSPADEVKIEDGQVAGHVVSVCQQNGRLYCLVSLKIASMDTGMVLSDGSALTITHTGLD